MDVQRRLPLLSYYQLIDTIMVKEGLRSRPASPPTSRPPKPLRWWRCSANRQARTGRRSTEDVASNTSA